jgi:hypothetical protein
MIEGMDFMSTQSVAAAPRPPSARVARCLTSAAVAAIAADGHVLNHTLRCVPNNT